MNRILLLEDHARLALLLCEGLASAGIVADVFSHIEHALAAVQQVQYQALVVDRGVPDGDGPGDLPGAADRLHRRNFRRRRFFHLHPPAAQFRRAPAAARQHDHSVSPAPGSVECPCHPPEQHEGPRSPGFGQIDDILIRRNLLEFGKCPVELAQKMMRRIAKDRVLPHASGGQGKAGPVAHPAQGGDGAAAFISA